MKTYESIQLTNRVMNLAFYANLGHPDLYWKEYEKKSSIESSQIKNWANKLLDETQSSTLYYQSNQV